MKEVCENESLEKDIISFVCPIFAQNKHSLFWIPSKVFLGII